MMTRFSGGYLVGGTGLPSSDDPLFAGSFFGSVAHFGVSRGNDIDDKDKCLSSLDGRPYTQVGGYKAEDKQTAKNGGGFQIGDVQIYYGPIQWSKRRTWSQGDLGDFVGV